MNDSAPTSSSTAVPSPIDSSPGGPGARSALRESSDIRASAAPGIPATVALAVEHELPDKGPRSPQSFPGEK